MPHRTSQSNYRASKFKGVVYQKPKVEKGLYRVMGVTLSNGMNSTKIHRMPTEFIGELLAKYTFIKRLKKIFISRGEGQRERDRDRDRESPKQAPCCQPGT